MQEVAAKRYSNALYQIGIEKNKLDVFLSQMQDIAQIFKNNKDFVEFLNSPNIEESQKKTVLEEIFKGKVEDEVLDLVLLLIENKRTNEVEIVYNEFKLLAYEYKGIKIAFVTTAVAMTNEEIEMLKSKLSTQFNTKVEVENIIDTTVIGGVSLKIGDEVIDDTIKGRVEKIRKNLIKGEM